MKPLHAALMFTLALLSAPAAAYASRFLSVGAGTPVLELLFRPFLKGPLHTKAGSAANQWAGLTTLGSGSATVTVSTNLVNSDSILLFSPQVALAAGWATQGRTAIASGLSIGTASTPAVYSGDVIGISWESPNAITSGQALRVDSIVNGISFAIATSNSLTTVASGAVAMWKIHGKDPVGIKVNTISDGGRFTLGWADGIARPFSTTVMWEMRPTK